MKAIITDLDRTLLHTDKTLSQYTVDVLKKCRNLGILVMANTARPWRAVKAYHEQIGFDAAATMNGAMVLFPQSRLEFGISHDCAEKILSGLLKFPEIFLSVETSGGLLSNRDIPELNPVIYHQFPKLPEGINIYKILVSSPKTPLYEHIESVLPQEVYHIVVANDLIQIMSIEATKWNGSRQMLSSFGVSSGEAVYFGDDNDDIESIKNCGLGVAVANAVPAVAAVADRIADSNDTNGVARFIEEYIF